MNSLERFRAVAVQYLGKELTPEAAAAIEQAAFGFPDESVDPDRFAPVRHGEYVIAVESFRQILEELKPLHAAHFAETERHRLGQGLNPDYEGICARERAGRAVQFTVRRDGELAGQLLMYVMRSTHTGCLVAEEDCLYMRPEHRGGFTAMALLRYAEATLKALGVVEIRCNSKTLNNADVLMRRMRYQQVAIQFVKTL